MEMAANMIVCQEVYGSTTVSKKYFKSTDKRIGVIDESPRWTSLSQSLRSVFLPQGYPESVSRDYLQYQIWDTIQAFASSITGTLAAQAVLKGVGVGDENATVLAATFTWLLKDGTGMLGRILFAWIHGTSLDFDAKRWRLFADILNDLAIFMEILAPNFKGFFTPIVCTAGIFKSIVGVAGSATRAALTQHQARRNNMADVSAKDGSQETLVNLAGLICSMTLVPIVTGKDGLIWTLYLLFTMLHLFANYSAVTCVVMETLNQARLHIIVKTYLLQGSIPSLVDVNYSEPVLWKTRRKLHIKLGCAVGSVFKSVDDLEETLMVYRDCNYLLNINPKKGTISIVLSQKSTKFDHLQSCFQAEVLSYVYDNLYKPKKFPSELQDIARALQEGDTILASSTSYHFTQSCMKSFSDHLTEEGWLLDPLLLGPDEWRAAWDLDGLSDKKDV